MSLRFSITTITSVATMLNAATSTMSSRTMKYTVFSSLMAEKRLWFISFQSRTRYGKPSRAAMARGDAVGALEIVGAHLDAGDRVAEVEEALRVGEGDVGERAVVLDHAGVEQADDDEALDLRHQADRRRDGDRRDQVDRIARLHVELAGELLAEDDAGQLDRRAARVAPHLVRVGRGLRCARRAGGARNRSPRPAPARRRAA